MNEVLCEPVNEDIQKFLISIHMTISDAIHRKLVTIVIICTSSTFCCRRHQEPTPFVLDSLVMRSDKVVTRKYGKYRLDKLNDACYDFSRSSIVAFHSYCCKTPFGLIPLLKFPAS